VRIAGFEGWGVQRHACGIFLVRGGMCGDKDGRAWGRASEETLAEELGRFAVKRGRPLG
jgi:hypothetical protein